MEVVLIVPKGTDITAIQREFPDLYEDEGWEEDEHWWLGKPDEETEDAEDDEGGQWVTYEEGVRFCGFCEGAVPEGSATFADNGSWADSMIRRRDFSGLAITDEGKSECKSISDLYWDAHAQGQLAIKPHPTVRNHETL